MKRAILTTWLVILTTVASADVIHLQNGDKITGEIISETGEEISVRTEAMGMVTVRKSYIKEEAAPTQEQEPGVKWTRTIALGYSESGGNDEDAEGSADLKLHRKTSDDEFHFRLKGSYDEVNQKRDNRQFYGMTRYAYSFGYDLKWYNFYKIEAEQNIASNVDYRITPSTGVGYWFSDRDDFKAMLEGAVGYERTEYRDGTDDSEAVLVPRGFVEKTFANGISISEDITLYPSLGDAGEFRLRSEFVLSVPVSNRLSWNFSFIDEYDSDPNAGTENNDYELITALEVSF